MLRILHKKIFSLILIVIHVSCYLPVEFFLNSLNSCTCSGRPGSLVLLRLAATSDRFGEKSGSVTSQFRKFAKNVGFFSKKAEKICENS